MKSPFSDQYITGFSVSKAEDEGWKIGEKNKKIPIPQSAIQAVKNPKTFVFISEKYTKYNI